MAEYNGWTNRATWQVALWLDNEEPLYRDMQAFARKGNVTAETTRTWFVVVILGRIGDKITLDEINWQEIVDDCVLPSIGETAARGVVISEPIYTGDPGDAIRELVTEAAEYAGPQDEDTSSNSGIWAAIDAAEEALRWQPLVVLDISGGVVQGEYLYAGVGKPIVHTLDFDREEADIDERRRFAEYVDEVCAVMRKRTDHPDDLTQLDDWAADAARLIAPDEEDGPPPDLNPEGDPTRNGAFG